MASVPFILEREIRYHGIWNAGIRLSDEFFKSISEEFVSKLSCIALLKLSPSALSLTVFSKGLAHLPPRQIRTNTIPFEAVRDVAINGYNIKCLMIIYVNSKNRYSVLVCSCRGAKESKEITLAYRRLKNGNLASRSNTDLSAVSAQDPNWVLRQKRLSLTPKANGFDNIGKAREYLADHNNNERKNYHDDNSQKEEEDGGSKSSPTQDLERVSIRSRTDSSFLSENFEFLNGEHDDDVFVYSEPEELEREAGPGDDAVSVGLMVDMKDQSDSTTLASRGSFSSNRPMLNENGCHESTEPPIAGEEFFKRKAQGLPNGSIGKDEEEEANGDAEQMGGQTGDNKGKSNGSHDNDINNEGRLLKDLVKLDTGEDPDFRSVGTQADLDRGLGRSHYTKRPGTVGSSNIYKSRAADRERKRNGVGADNDNDTTTNTTTNTMPSNGPSHSLNHIIAKRVHPTPTNRAPSAPLRSQYQSLYLPRNVSNSDNWVSRPIEDVYSGHTLGRRGHHQSGTTRRKRIVVVNPDASSKPVPSGLSRRRPTSDFVNH